MHQSDSGGKALNKFYTNFFNTKKIENYVYYDKMKNYLINQVNIYPYNEYFWFSLAKLEYSSFNYSAYIYFLLKGLKKCITSELLWKEIIRFKSKSNFKILNYAIKSIPKSIFVWDELLKIKNNTKSHLRNLLIRALFYLPTQSKYWKKLITLEKKSIQKTLLYRAIECCPKDIELWETIINFEKYTCSKKLLNIARNINPKSLKIWIFALKLEESNGNINNIKKVIKRLINVLDFETIDLKRSHIINFSQSLENEYFIYKKSIKHLLHQLIKKDIKLQNCVSKWLGIISETIKNGCILNTVYIFKSLLSYFDKNPIIVLKFLLFLYYSFEYNRFQIILTSKTISSKNFEILNLIWARFFSFSSGYFSQKANNRFTNQNNFLSANSLVYIFRTSMSVKNVALACTIFTLSRKYKRMFKNPFTSFLYLKLLNLIGNKSEVAYSVEEEWLKNCYDLRKFRIVLISLNRIHIKYKNEAIKIIVRKSPTILKDFLIFIKVFFQENSSLLNYLCSMYYHLKNQDIYWYLLKKKIYIKDPTANALALILKGIKTCYHSNYLWKELVKTNLIKNDKYLCYFSLLYVEDTSVIMCLMASYFWNSIKINKARLWFLKSLKLSNGNYLILSNVILFEKNTCSIKNYAFLLQEIKRFWKTKLMLTFFQELNCYVCSIEARYIFKFNV